MGVATDDVEVGDHGPVENTMWKFRDFTVTWILREINFGECRNSKNTVFAILGTLIFVNLVNIILKKVQKFRAARFVKMADFET